MFLRLRRAIALLLIVGVFGLIGCGGDRDVPVVLLEDNASGSTSNPLVGLISEVSPPERIQQLKPYLDVYEPQVRIAFPHDNETLQDTTLSVDLQIRDFPIYKDQELALGPRLHLVLDDQPYREIYETETPITFSDVSPGTHTLRVFAVRPWGESFKNEGAYDQITFNIYTTSPSNNPDDSQPLLTVNEPQGTYGAEPILLDFYLNNAPLHVVAEEDEAVSDWRIRCTINGEAFVFDRWQPIYLKGFQPGKNWVKLEIIDDNGALIDNAFNTGVRLIEYTPGEEDALSKLIRGEISLTQAKSLVDPTYVPPTPPAEPAPTVEDLEQENEPGFIDTSERAAEQGTSDEQQGNISEPSSLEEQNQVEDVPIAIDEQPQPAEEPKGSDSEGAIDTLPVEPLPETDTRFPNLKPDLETDGPSAGELEEVPVELTPDASIEDSLPEDSIPEDQPIINNEALDDLSPELDDKTSNPEPSPALGTPEQESAEDTTNLFEPSNPSAFDDSSTEEIPSELEDNPEKPLDSNPDLPQSDESPNFDPDVLETPIELLEDEADLI
ncbi:hypothetical protein PN498_25140 [Oscillatoria sp. CS-180]|uniref:hypothetical protein n=1 Tax=Oscillatoria sp. CS-180 TaxID=3021720 RepID=UPI0023313701|nr:hypothetical protein [Oscillatoria sp. CS-180]MDB9529302.1 hypothetical protein [Oscillatoria sp. CS-180]